MVRDEDAVESVFYRQTRIFMRVDAFDHELAAPELPKLIDELPVHRRIRRPDARHIDTFEHGTLTDRARRFARAVAGCACILVLWPHPAVRFTVPAGRVVD